MNTSTARLTNEPNIREVDKKFITVAEAGAQLGVKRARAYELVHAGLIPSVRLAKRIYVPASALDRMAEAAIEKALDQSEDRALGL